MKLNRSNFIPPKGTNNELDTILDRLNDKLADFKKVQNKRKYNFSKAENRFLQDLRNNQSLHITKADKGGSFVVMDNNFYITCMTNEHTSDTQTYEKVEYYKPHMTLEKIKNLCKKFQTTCNFTKKEIDYLTNFNCVLPFLYGLPKIHKVQEQINKVSPDEFGYIKIAAPIGLKFRPIISSSFAPTSHMSAFLDEVLKPIIPSVLSYCRHLSFLGIN